MNRKDRARLIDELIEAVGLTAQKLQRPEELSGGQQQRVAIARALVTKPSIVLADEPSANLDSETAQSIMKLIHDINERFHTCFLLATHDPEIIPHVDTIYRIKDGYLIETDTSA